MTDRLANKLGFTRAEVSGLLFGEMVIGTAIVLPLVMALGYGLAHLVSGLVSRRLVGYGRLTGVHSTAATKALATLYASSRLYINFFQPSFKLKSKTREGARRD